MFAIRVTSSLHFGAECTVTLTLANERCATMESRQNEKANDRRGAAGQCRDLNWANRGASIFKMRAVSRHKSIDVLSSYVRDADAFTDHAGAGLL
jgi:hypothetical protein